MRTAVRPLAALALPLTAVLALSACGGDADAETAAPATEEETVTFTWERNVAGEDEEPEYEETTVEVPKNPAKIVTFDIASLDTIGALGGEVTGAPLDNVPDYLQGYLADDAFNAGALPPKLYRRAVEHLRDHNLAHVRALGSLASSRSRRVEPVVHLTCVHADRIVIRADE